VTTLRVVPDMDAAAAPTDDPRILDCGHTEVQHGRMRCAQVRAIEARIAATPPNWRERLDRRWNQRP
jgi:hypothetical protein